MTAQPDHWNEHPRQWNLIDPPLRWAQEGIRLLEAETQDWLAGAPVAAPRAPNGQVEAFVCAQRSKAQETPASCACWSA